MSRSRPTFRAAAVRVRVPATSANLGPGFDALGLALGLWDDVIVRITEEPGLSVDVAGMGAATVSRGPRHLVVRSMRATFDLLGGQPPGLELVCANRIPHGRGLGSSAAAIVAGVVAARELVAGGRQRIDQETALRIAASIEGHPDNVAACLLGGLTLAWTDETGSAHAINTPVSRDLSPVAFVPGSSASTRAARKLLPQTVPHADAVKNSARAALLITALSGRPELLLEATTDRLHQTYRAPAMPRSLQLVERLRADGVPAVISGAGPTVLALTTAGGRPAILDRAGRGWTAMPLDVDRAGAAVVPV